MALLMSVSNDVSNKNANLLRGWHVSTKGRTRTGTPYWEADFESAASTNSATLANATKVLLVEVQEWLKRVK